MKMLSCALPYTGKKNILCHKQMINSLPVVAESAALICILGPAGSLSANSLISSPATLPGSFLPQ